MSQEIERLGFLIENLKKTTIAFDGEILANAKKMTLKYNSRFFIMISDRV